MRRLILIFLFTTALAVTTVGPGVAQSRLERMRGGDSTPDHRTNAALQDVLSKFRSCAAGRAACSEACDIAVKSFQDTPEGDAEAISRCNTAYAEVVERGSGRMLVHETYAWVRDVEGVVVPARGLERRKGFKISADENPDWVTHCGSQAKANGQIGLDAQKKLVPGVRVRLMYVQHDTTKTAARAPGGKCQFGAFEVIGSD